MLRDDDVAGRLENLEFAIIEVARYALHEAPRIRIEKLRRRIGVVLEHLVHLFQGPRLIGDLSVRRIDDETFAALRRVIPEILIARLKPQVLDVVERADGVPHALDVRLAVGRPRRRVPRQLALVPPGAERPGLQHRSRAGSAPAPP